MRVGNLLIVFLAVCAIATALSAYPANSEAPIGSPNTAPPKDFQIEPAFDTLRNEVAELRKKIEKPPKDIWDKLAAISGLISGLAVALIGFYATNVYNRRQRQSEERRKEQELLISQLQTVESFIPHLSSKDENVKAGALIAISALGNETLAVKLATAFGGPGATVALTSIASAAGPQAAASAGRALQDIFQYLIVRVVRIWCEKADGEFITAGQGFIVASHGVIVTASYVVKDEGIDRVIVRLNDGRKFPACILKVDERIGLALLKVDSTDGLETLKLNSSEVVVGERVVGLLAQDDGTRRIEVGNIVGITTGNKSEGQRLIASLNINPRDDSYTGGSVAADTAGNVVGLIYSIDSSRPGTTFLIASEVIDSFVNEAIVGASLGQS